MALKDQRDPLSDTDIALPRDDYFLPSAAPDRDFYHRRYLIARRHFCILLQVLQELGLISKPTAVNYKNILDSQYIASSAVQALSFTPTYTLETKKHRTSSQGIQRTKATKTECLVSLRAALLQCSRFDGEVLASDSSGPSIISCWRRGT